MTLSVSCPFDGGNIRLVAIEGDRIDLEIERDHQSDFYQWFYFRVTGAGGRLSAGGLLTGLWGR